MLNSERQVVSEWDTYPLSSVTHTENSKPETSRGFASDHSGHQISIS